MLGPDKVRSQPVWVRGPAEIDGDEIVLDGSKVERYLAFDPEHATRLLFDFGDLGKLGEMVEVEDPDARFIDAIQITEPDHARAFAEAHGLIWHGPNRVGRGEVRESLKEWYIAGAELAISTATYARIRASRETGSAEPVRSYLRMLRDAQLFHRLRFPDDDDDLLEWASIQLAEKISRGMAECTPTFSAVHVGTADGEQASGVREFGFGNDPGSLVGAANYQLASLVSRKKIVRDCEECGEMFIPEDPRTRFHPRCGNRKRQRESRQRRKAK